jgi:lipoprotein-releasing system permease protein
MNFLFAWRYFKSKKTTGAINIIAWISVIAIAVGTAALIVVLSVFNGFEDLVKSLYRDFYSDISITPASGKWMKLDSASILKIKTNPAIAHYSLAIEEKAILVKGDTLNSNTITTLKGVDENYTFVSDINRHVEYGKYDLGTADSPKIIMGVGVENALQSYPDDKNAAPLIVYMPNPEGNFSDMANALHSYQIAHSGTFRLQEDFDNKYAITNIDFMRYMLNAPADKYSSMDIDLNNQNNVGKVQKELQHLLSKDYAVKTRYQQNQNLFVVMQNEKWAIYLILSLILVVAAFNMIGAITMLVLEKQKDIAILKALGAHNYTIRNIFLSEGFLLAALGAASGMLIAFGICFAQIKWHLIKLTDNSNFIVDYYPVKFSIYDFLLVGATVFVVASLAAWVPSKKAAKQFYNLRS